MKTKLIINKPFIVISIASVLPALIIPLLIAVLNPDAVLACLFPLIYYFLIYLLFFRAVKFNEKYVLILKPFRFKKVYYEKIKACYILRRYIVFSRMPYPTEYKTFDDFGKIKSEQVCKPIMVFSNNIADMNDIKSNFHFKFERRKFFLFELPYTKEYIDKIFLNFTGEVYMEKYFFTRYNEEVSYISKSYGTKLNFIKSPNDFLEDYYD